MLNVKLFYIKRVGNWSLFNVQKKYFFLLTFFGYILTILAWTKCRLVTKHLLSITHFHSCFFLTFFPFKFYLCKNLSCPSRIICYLIIPSFQSHQTRILNAGMGMAWNRYGLPCFNGAYWFDFELVMLSVGMSWGMHMYSYM